MLNWNLTEPRRLDELDGHQLQGAVAVSAHGGIDFKLDLPDHTIFTIRAVNVTATSPALAGYEGDQAEVVEARTDLTSERATAEHSLVQFLDRYGGDRPTTLSRLDVIFNSPPTTGRAPNRWLKGTTGSPDYSVAVNLAAFGNKVTITYQFTFHWEQPSAPDRASTSKHSRGQAPRHETGSGPAAP